MRACSSVQASLAVGAAVTVWGSLTLLDPALQGALDAAGPNDTLFIVVEYDEAVTTGDALAAQVMDLGAGAGARAELPFVESLATPVRIREVRKMPNGKPEERERIPDLFEVLTRSSPDSLPEWVRKFEEGPAGAFARLMTALLIAEAPEGFLVKTPRPFLSRLPEGRINIFGATVPEAIITFIDTILNKLGILNGETKQIIPGELVQGQKPIDILNVSISLPAEVREKLSPEELRARKASRFLKALEAGTVGLGTADLYYLTGELAPPEDREDVVIDMIGAFLPTLVAPTLVGGFAGARVAQALGSS